MKTNIILSGVGGQGILTIAAVLDTAALSEDLFIKQSEVHGMSQRGGAVQSHVRISDKEIFSDLIPEGQADLILSVEPMELLRYMPFLKKDGWLVTDSESFINTSNYPDKKELFNQIKKHPNHVIVDATEIAKKIGNSKAANMVLLGAASAIIPLSEDSLVKAIKELFQHKSERIIKLNLEAFAEGKKVAEGITDLAASK
ncbi:indolepyruvate ferredoxin oxidoreductase beta subunit [Salinimicrobium catena]|uniref:Indolepyruvate ferredoxin oxidoreductase beta subunit n=1 Tax=Salinimicrobium catena TaxID=390640 RepID=A0A1H5NY64_9FLAO|nr:indolepyruvate oxidoreductase subunit beta [Salinimicrobium catena]SDL59873.1 indolepyruvate ferredoxin oxidoreductase beta subunit [Salinimicrobium catena]SEF05658.1 indolepyruvate ferredoxin oxidoreductase beta subunit [Salinimicrobium catena]